LCVQPNFCFIKAENGEWWWAHGPQTTGNLAIGFEERGWVNPFDTKSREMETYNKISLHSGESKCFTVVKLRYEFGWFPNRREGKDVEDELSGVKSSGVKVIFRSDCWPQLIPQIHTNWNCTEIALQFLDNSLSLSMSWREWHWIRLPWNWTFGWAPPRWQDSGRSLLPPPPSHTPSLLPSNEPEAAIFV